MLKKEELRRRHFTVLKRSTLTKMSRSYFTFLFCVATVEKWTGQETTREGYTKSHVPRSGYSIKILIEKRSSCVLSLKFTFMNVKFSEFL